MSQRLNSSNSAHHVHSSTYSRYFAGGWLSGPSRGCTPECEILFAVLYKRAAVGFTSEMFIINQSLPSRIRMSGRRTWRRIHNKVVNRVSQQNLSHKLTIIAYIGSLLH